ncbi:uncharacterized protein LOC120514462 isoform X2 [Polypterus senegalus]|uniref:uncharacterized protein LOC120514462 isoform X2 n=1 Tax=Polypterus senegalus TaxID=55291 RepID=UPI0019667399|nr:uncharacterized protein LOC120514462 isoform X2 [Polypterus senegalus]
MKWLRGSEILIQEHLEPLQNPDGTFNAVGHYEYTPGIEDIGVPFTCQAEIESENKQLLNITHQICKPALALLPSTLFVGQENNVTCKVRDCLFSSVTVSLKINGTTFNKTCKNVTECEIQEVLVGQEGEALVCAAETVGLVQPLKELLNFTVAGKWENENMKFMLLMLLILPFVVLLVCCKFCKTKISVDQKCTFRRGSLELKKPTWWIKRKEQWCEITHDDQYAVQNPANGNSTPEQTSMLES